MSTKSSIKEKGFNCIELISHRMKVLNMDPFSTKITKNLYRNERH